MSSPTDRTPTAAQGQRECAVCGQALTPEGKCPRPQETACTMTDEGPEVSSAASINLHPWLTPEEAQTLSEVLIGVWEDAEENDDEATVEKAKAALDHLQLPWVRS